jgi:hypothetical protein
VATKADAATVMGSARCRGILTLDPVPRAAGDVGRAEAFRHDPLEAELAGVAENDVATLCDMFIQLHGPGGFADQLGKRSGL